MLTFHSPSSHSSTGFMITEYRPSAFSTTLYLSPTAICEPWFHHTTRTGRLTRETAIESSTSSPILTFLSISDSVKTGADFVCVLRDLEISNTAVEEIVPMQLTASHLYTDTGRSMLACRAKTSPDLISSPSLNHRRAGDGIPTTLHSRDTVPCSVSPATNSSRNTGDL